MGGAPTVGRSALGAARQPLARWRATASSARSGRPSACARAVSGDQVGQLGHRLQVARLGQPREAQRVERVAGQQAQVAVHAREGARLAVVQEVALVDGLEHEQPVGIGHHARRSGPARDPRPRARPAPAPRPRPPAPARSRRHLRQRTRAPRRGCAPRARRCGRARETRPRTATAAGRRPRSSMRAAEGGVGVGVALLGVGVVAHRPVVEEGGEQARRCGSRAAATPALARPRRAARRRARRPRASRRS